MATVLAFSTTRRRPKDGPAPPRPPANPAELWLGNRKAGRSQQSGINYLDTLTRLLGHSTDEGQSGVWRDCPWWTLGYTDVARLRTTLVGKVTTGQYTAGHANHILQVLKGVLREVWRMGADGHEYLTDKQWLLIQDVARVSGKKLRRPRRTLTEEEFTRLIEHCAADKSARGYRDAALFALARSVGFRASEYTALVIADYDRAGRRIRVPMIKVETEEAEWLDLYDREIAYLEAWLAVRGTRPGALFTRLERGGMSAINTLNQHSINEIMRRRGAEVGITDFSSHATRRGCGTLIILETGNPAIAQRRLRHAQLDTTISAYWNPTEAQLREATAKAKAGQAPETK